MAHETEGLLIGEAASAETRRVLMALVKTDPIVTRVNELITLQMGPQTVVVNMSLEFADELTLDELEQSITRMNRGIRKRFPEVGRVFIEAESWVAHREQIADAAEPPGSEHPPSA